MRLIGYHSRYDVCTSDGFCSLDNLSDTSSHLLGEVGQFALEFRSGLGHHLVDQLKQSLEGLGSVTPSCQDPNTHTYI